MARNGSGTYVKVNTFASGQPVTASGHNQNWDDLATEMTNSVAADGQTTMTGPLKAANGSEGAPSHSFGSDTNTGAYRSGADEYSITTGGTRRVAVSSAGLDIKSGGLLFNGVAGLALTGVNITSAAALTAPAVDDELPIYDLDTTTNKKITLANILKVVNGLTQDTSPDKAADFALTYDASGSAAKKVLLAALSQALGSASGLGMGNNSGTPNTNVDIVATQAVLINPTGNVPLLVSSVSLTCNTTTGGAGTSTANGMDGTARGNSAWYHFFIISDGTTTASLCSSSPTAPSMPSGYVYWLRVGAMRTDGSGNFLRIQQVGNRSQYIVTGGTNTVLMPSLQSGALGTYSATAPTYAAVGVGNSVPTTARQIIVAVTNSYGAATAANVIVAPNNAYGGPQAANGSYPPFFAPSGANMVLTGSMNLESSSIYYASSAAGGAVNCLGWIDAVNAA
jgi:hypothetical protein